MRVAIIGAGLTGLTAARHLTDAGVQPVIYDKGRGLGGRLATRRAEGGLQFDHGAQYLSASSTAFATFLEDLQSTGAATQWQVAEGATKTVGHPGMSGVAKHLASGMDIHRSTTIERVEQNLHGWRLAGEVFDRVICTVPAPQVIALIGADHPLAAPVQVVEMVPNLTLMFALPADAPIPFASHRAPDGVISWLACDSTKHGRPGPTCWVAQAGEAWSRAHLELTKEEIATKMLPMACRLIGADPDQATYVAGHRWRYAMAAKPLGQDYLQQDGLFIGGDWALSDRAEGAWRSGLAMAKAVLDTRTTG